MQLSRYVVHNSYFHHFNLHCIPLQNIHNTSINTLMLMHFYGFKHIRQTDAVH